MYRSNTNNLVRLTNKLIAYFFRLLIITVTLLSLAGYLGQLNMYLELTTNFKFQYLLLGLIALFFFALSRRRTWCIVTLFCILVNLTEIVPCYIPPSGINNINSGEEMRLFLFNVLHENTRYADTISLVKSEKPTIAVFLEATPPWPKELKPLQETLSYHVSAKKLQIEIYSSLPIENTSIKLYGKYRGLVLFNVRIKGEELLIIATHAYPQLYFGQEGFQWRNQQLEEGIGNYIKQISKPVILIGDLNVTMWSPYYKNMIQRSGLYNARDGFGILPTQSALSPKTPTLAIPLDHCLLSSDIQVKNIKTGSYIGSDHLPLITDVLVPTQMPLN